MPFHNGTTRRERHARTRTTFSSKRAPCTVAHIGTSHLSAVATWPNECRRRRRARPNDLRHGTCPGTNLLLVIEIKSHHLPVHLHAALLRHSLAHALSCCRSHSLIVHVIILTRRGIITVNTLGDPPLGLLAGLTRRALVGLNSRRRRRRGLQATTQNLDSTHASGTQNETREGCAGKEK